MLDADPANPIVWGLTFLLAGAGFVLIAKIYGLIFMRGKTPHRIGDAMNVNRAEVVDWSGGEGHVNAGGELWRATSKDELSPGDKVCVLAVNGLSLSVRHKRD